MFRISDKNTTPPGGWYYVQPESGRIFKHYSHDSFFDEIRAHRLAQGYPIEPDWQAEIEDEICRTHPEWALRVCNRVERHGLERRPLSLAAMQSFINVVAAWIGGAVLGRRVWVEQEEADRRAAICAQCDLNVAISGSCAACADQFGKVLAIVGSRKTALDKDLGACSLCGCLLRVAVHVPLEAQCAGVSQKLRDEFGAVPYCWKHCG
jgi:hypothetical protein